MRRHRKDMPPMSSMNLTSLLDITFVLLIAFMIVAPTLNRGLDIDLPQVEESDDITPREPVRISIVKREDPAGEPEIFLNNRRLTMPELRNELSDLHSVNEEATILVQADRREEIEIFLQVQGAIQGAGFEGFAVEADQP